MKHTIRRIAAWDGWLTSTVIALMLVGAYLLGRAT
jgi:hypothetical protein